MAFQKTNGVFHNIACQRALLYSPYVSVVILTRCVQLAIRPYQNSAALDLGRLHLKLSIFTTYILRMIAPNAASNHEMSSRHCAFVLFYTSSVLKLYPPCCHLAPYPSLAKWTLYQYSQIKLYTQLTMLSDLVI